MTAGLTSRDTTTSAVTSATNSGNRSFGPATSAPAWRHYSKRLTGLAGLLVLLATWWAGTDVMAAPGSFVHRFAPGPTFASLIELLRSSDLPTHVLVSLRRVLVGLGFALLIGVPVGLAIGNSSLLNAATSPSFQFLRMISPLSWMPLAVMMFGVGDRPIYFLLTFAAVWPILLNTAEGCGGCSQVG